MATAEYVLHQNFKFWQFWLDYSAALYMFHTRWSDADGNDQNVWSLVNFCMFYRNGRNENVQLLCSFTDPWSLWQRIRCLVPLWLVWLSGTWANMLDYNSLDTWFYQLPLDHSVASHVVWPRGHREKMMLSHPFLAFYHNCDDRTKLLPYLFVAYGSDRNICCLVYL